jgi:hypothetical protein
MVQHSTGDDGRFLNANYYEVRRQAREETYNLRNWGDIDITRYDLETVDFDRKGKESAFVQRAQIEAEGASQSGEDIRDIPTIRY